jgi:hypothetical protein
MRRTTTGTVLCISSLLLSAIIKTQGTAAEPDSKRVDFNRDVRPLLAAKCYACHGPDEGKRKGKFRLDVKEDALKKAIKPGDGAGSLLVKRVTSDDLDKVMPPPSAKTDPLTPQQIDLLRRWIDEGARFDLHWAYAKPNRTSVPEVKNKGWVNNAIDAFIAAGQEKQGFEPAPEADRLTLLRRLSFDLIGLPPTPGEVDAFTKDQSANAYEKVVDRLLASPHYGERMAAYWLDLVRYADTAGYHSDNHRDVALYRDYVIDAFNTNKGFDRFTIEQLAGDLLPNPTREQKIASGYNRLLQTTEEGGAQAKEYLAKYAADRVRNASVVWLASTMGCCECHNHKFDPFTSKDFYGFEAFFADLKETAVGRQVQTPIPTKEQEAELRTLDERIVAAKAVVDQQTPELDAAQFEWEKTAKAELADHKAWTAVKPEKVASKGSKLVVQDDLSVLSTGANPDKDVYTVTLKPDNKAISGIQLEVLTHPSLANKSLSKANGNFVLTGFEVQVTASGEKDAKPVKIAKALADFAQQGWPIEHAIDNDPTTGWAVEGHVKATNHAAVFVFDQPITGGEGTTLTVVLKHESVHAGHNIGRFRLSLTSAEKPALPGKALPGDVAAALEVELEQRTPQQTQAVSAYFRTVAPQLSSAREQVAKLENDRKQLTQKFATSLISIQVGPRPIRILPRGNWLDDTGEVVTPNVPAFLPALDMKDRRATRFDLANWIVGRDNPLTARVFVNRLWKVMYGQGLVKSLDDFGTQGTLPSHAELFDWLAVEFVESGWDVKHVLKLMAMSNTYRQSSVATKELRERDPNNVWLARQNRFRLDAEMVRDNALAVSGLLSPQIGGPSVKPYQPAGYWSYLNFPKREWVSDKGEGLYRRGLYTYWCRTFLHPSLAAFDAPSREECTVERPRSSTPLQALVLLNDPIYVEAARVFAERIVREGGVSPADRVKWALRRALSREIKSEELDVLVPLYEKHLAEYGKDKDAAQKVIGVGDYAMPKDVDVAELAAWTSVARVILNLHETITRN